MKITSEKIELSTTESIAWSEIKKLRQVNNKLAVELNSGKTIELSKLHPATIDRTFRAYEYYLKQHPSPRL